MKLVQIAQLEVSTDVDDVLAATGLGSCVALVLVGANRDRHPVFGLAHVLLPHSAADTRRRRSAPAKFADTAVPALVRSCLEAGARRSSLGAALVGGARMFQFSAASGRDIGERNAAALEQALDEARIPLRGRDVGGTVGRSVRMVLAEGMVYVRGSGQVERPLLDVTTGPLRFSTEGGHTDGTRVHRR